MINLKKNKKKSGAKKDSLQNPKILEVNLVKDQSFVSFNWSKNISLLLIGLLIAGVLVIEAYYSLNSWQKKEAAKIALTNKKIDDLKTQIIDLKNNNQDALAYKDKSAAFSALLNNHIYWTRFFVWLEKNTLSSVKYNGFGGDLSGNYTLQATAPTYADVSWQVKAFLNDPQVEKVSVKYASRSKSEEKEDKGKPSQVSFSLSLKINPSLFTK